MPTPLDEKIWREILAARDMDELAKEITIADAITHGDFETAAGLMNISLDKLQETMQKGPLTFPVFSVRQGALHLDTLTSKAYSHLLTHTLEREADTHVVIEHPEVDLLIPETRERILIYSPSIRLLEELRTSQISLHDLHWRQLEELVAELLTRDGYRVQLGRGTKDGGVDIIAIKEDPIHGFFMAIWQAKKLKVENKVGIHVIRELADTRRQHNATKGIIVTTTSLTKGALERIEQDRYLLGKVDGNDLYSWIQKGKG